MPRNRIPLAVAAAATAALAGCSAPQDASALPADGSSATVENCGRTETFTKTPSRVVILNGTSVAEAESFVVLGLSDRIVANMQSYGASDVPSLAEKVAALPKAGLTVNQNFDVPAEQLLALAPDLVVSTWSGGFDKNSGFATRDELAAIGANTLVNPANCANGDPGATAEQKQHYETVGVEGSFDLFRLLGKVFHVEDKAATVIGDAQQQLARTAAAIKDKKTVSGLVLSEERADRQDAAVVGADEQAGRVRDDQPDEADAAGETDGDRGAQGGHEQQRQPEPAQGHPDGDRGVVAQRQGVQSAAPRQQPRTSVVHLFRGRYWGTFRDPISPPSGRCPSFAPATRR